MWPPMVSRVRVGHDLHNLFIASSQRGLRTVLLLPFYLKSFYVSGIRLTLQLSVQQNMPTSYTKTATPKQHLQSQKQT